MVNGGNRYETHLVDKFLDPDGNIIKEVKPVVLEKTNISESTINLIKEKECWKLLVILKVHI